MANNVNSYISFENLSQEAYDFLEKLMPDYQTSSDEIVAKIYDAPEDTREWYEENIGAKWINFEDISGEGMTIVTAWSAPEAFYKSLYEKMVSLNSPDAMLWASFDDEMPNFVGVYGLGPNDYDYEEYLDEEDYEQCIGCTPHCKTDDGWEHNEDWWDKFDEWRDKEYNYFIEGFNDWMEDEG